MAKIHVERMMHRSSIAVSGESAVSYALIKLIPTGLGAKPMGLNIALCLDVSGAATAEVAHATLAGCHLHLWGRVCIRYKSREEANAFWTPILRRYSPASAIT